MEVAACLIPIEVALVHRSLFPSQHAPILGSLTSSRVPKAVSLPLDSNDYTGHSILTTTRDP